MVTAASTRHRSRATSACLPCRKARIRCVTNRPKSACVNCTDNGLECRFDTKDGRKERASAKAITEALTKRVRQLEDLLRTTQAVQPPPLQDVVHVDAGASAAAPMDLASDRHEDDRLFLLIQDDGGADAETPALGHAEAPGGMAYSSSDGFEESGAMDASPTPAAVDGIVVSVAPTSDDLDADGTPFDHGGHGSSSNGSRRSSSRSDSAFDSPLGQQHHHRSASRGGAPSPGTSASSATTVDTAAARRTVAPVAASLPIRFDMASGRVRYFGPTTCANVLSHLERAGVDGGGSGSGSGGKGAGLGSPDHWPIGLVVRDLTPAAHDHLMERFWTCYNACLQTVHRAAFEAGLAGGGGSGGGTPSFYSLFLHVAMLATGFRFADKRRADVRRLARGGGSGGRFASTLHETAVALAKGELDGPGGLPSIQALALLADVEFHLGRDESGWLFAGMSLRLVTDVGLHIDPGPLGLSALETQVRHVVLWACIQHDLYWSLYLGRPTSLKLADIAPACLARDGLRSAAGDGDGGGASLAARVAAHDRQLMARMRPLCDRARTAAATAPDMAAAAADLRAWHDALPADVQWSAQHAGMPAAFYLMHSRYHALLVLLHRPFVQGGTADAAAARAACRWHAGRVTEVFAAYGRHLDLALVFGTAVSHIGTAATSLLHEAVLAAGSGGGGGSDGDGDGSDGSDSDVSRCRRRRRRHSRHRRATVIAQLRSARHSMQRMAETYPLARHMQQMVDEFLAREEDTKTAAAAAAAAAAATAAAAAATTVVGTRPQRSVCCCCAGAAGGTAGGGADAWGLPRPGYGGSGYGSDAAAAAAAYNLDPRLWALPGPVPVPAPAPASPTTLQSLPCLAGLEAVDFPAGLGGYSPCAFDWQPGDMSPL